MINNNIEIYIHIPFCEKKCNYCDFISFPSNEETFSLYVKKLCEEIISKSIFFTNNIVSTIFIGGGTPSIIDSTSIYKILDTLYKHYKISNDAEISIELNPNSATKSKLIDYKSININRLSIGLQSANDNELKYLGRVHTYNDFLVCYDNASKIGFTNINIDIMNQIPLQTIITYKTTLKQILAISPKHLSIYNLIIEPNTYFYKLYKDNYLKLPSEITMKKIDEITNELTTLHNYKRYEISNYSKSGFECKHNLGYWSDESYIGFGLNSSSYYDSVRLKNIVAFDKYMNLNFNEMNDFHNPNFYENIAFLTKKDLMSEYFILGMRKIKGIDKRLFFEKFNEQIMDVFYAPLVKYINLELIIKRGDMIYFSDRGLDVSNRILSEFLL